MIVRITGLRVRGYHGVLDSERRDGQWFVVDAALTLDPPASDDLADTADYATLSARLADVVAGEPVDLIETLAARLADACLADPRVHAAEVTVHKPEAPVPVPVAEVSVTLVRTRAVLSLGANLGDRAATLRDAVDVLAQRVAVLAVSPFYETAPVGGPDQPRYLNAVVLVATSLAPSDLLALAHEVEDAAGRERAERWGPRTLDVDVVAYGDVRSTDPDLTLPHPRAHERAFVLRPWLDVDPHAVLPGHGRVADLLPRAVGEVRRA